MIEQSKSMTRAIKFFDDAGWKYNVLDDGNLKGEIGGDSGRWQWLLQELGQRGFLAFYARCPVNTPRGKLAAVAEYLARANWGMHFGNFELDWADGEVYFRTSIPIGATGVTQKAIGHLIYGNCSNMDRYLPGLLGVALGDANPQKAIQDAERTPALPPANESSADAEAEPLHLATPTSPPGVQPSPGEATGGRLGRLFQNDN